MEHTLIHFLKRSTLFRGQAPEAFNYESYLKANRSLTHEELLAINGSSEVAVKCGIDVAPLLTVIREISK